MTAPQVWDPATQTFKDAPGSATVIEVTLDANLAPFLEIACSTPGGAAISAGDGIAYVRIPEALNGLNLIRCAAHVSTAPSAAAVNLQLRRTHSGSDADMLSTPITIDVSETDTATAATPAVIDTTKDDVATGDLIWVDVDVAGTGTKGLLVILEFGT